MGTTRLRDQSRGDHTAPRGRLGASPGGWLGCWLVCQGKGHSELPGVWGSASQFQVDFAADIHPGAQPEIHPVRAVDELLKLLSTDALTHFPDAVGRPLRRDRAKAMVVEASVQVLGNSLVPAATRSHGGLSALPPKLSFASSKLVVNNEELGSHQQRQKPVECPTNQAAAMFKKRCCPSHQQR